MNPEHPPGTPPDPGPRRSRLAVLVTASCVLALAGLVVTLVHFLWPTPLMFALFMTVGQGSFGLAIALYMGVILADLRRKKVL